MSWWQWQRVDDRATDLPTFVRKVNDNLLKLTHVLRPLEGFFGPNGQAFIGDSANANNTGGLTINQGAADDRILDLKSSDVAHGLTSQVETDTYGSFWKTNAAEGGLVMDSFAEDAAVTVVTQIRSFGGTADTTKSTSGRALVEVLVYEHDGANALANITADGNVFGVRCRRGGSDVTLLLVDEDGDVWVGGAMRIVGNVGFYDTAPGAKPTVTGSRGGNAALASLLTGLAGLGLITDSTTA